MTLLERLESARHSMIEGQDPPATDEDVLAQFLYNALGDCFESDTVIGAFQEAADQSWADDADMAFDRALNEWIDTYADELVHTASSPRSV